jgi:tRNA(Ser,Leu) C12 N-acetylase TAN1
MWKFNVVVTMSSEGRYRHLLDELSSLGEFRSTEFLGVVLGQVADREAFLGQVHEKRRDESALRDLRRVIPLDRVFTFHLEEFQSRLRESIVSYVDDLGGKRFYVRLERRGLKGQIVSPEVERELDGFILQTLQMSNKRGSIDFEDPDAVLVIETIGDRCGVGLLTREMMERYDFVRVG